MLQGFLETFSGLGMMVGPPLGGALYEVCSQFNLFEPSTPAVFSSPEPKAHKVSLGQKIKVLLLETLLLPGLYADFWKVGGGANLRVFTKRGANLKKILILRPKLGV